MSLAKETGNDSLATLKSLFLNSHWPRCNELAKSIAQSGGLEAQQALLAGLKVRRHHVRSAAIRALAQLGDKSVAKYIEPHLNDLSYEVRMDTKEALKSLTGKEVKTGRGE